MSLIPHETVHPSEAISESEAPFAPHAIAGGLRLEDALRLLLAGVLVFLGGLGLGSFTFHELAGRGTGYFIIAICCAVVFTALAYYKFELCLSLFIAMIWLDLGQTPDLATGVSSGTGKALYPAELAALFLLFIWGLRRLSKKQAAPIKTPLDKPLWIYLAFSVWTAVNGNLFWDPAVAHYYAGIPGGGRPVPQVIVLELALRVLSIGVFWMIANSLTDLKWLRRASFLLLLPGLLMVAVYFKILPISISNWSVMLETPLACILWAWILENPSAIPIRRLAAGVGLALLIVQVFVLNITWISGWLSLFAGLLFIAFLNSKRLFTGLICTTAVLVLCAQPILQEKIVHKVQVSGDLDRLSMMRGALLYALHFPLGIGPANYRAYNAYYGGVDVWNTTPYTSAHNFYAQSLSEMGFIGLILTVVWVIAGLVMLARFYGRMSPGFSRTVTLAIGGLWAGIAAASAVGDYFIPVYYNGGLQHLATTLYAWIGLGLAVAHARQAGALEEAPVILKPVERAAGRTKQSYYPRRITR